LKKLFPKTEFTKHTFTLIAGTMLAQLLPIAISPIITRLYSPGNLAVIGLYMSLVNVLLSLSTGSFELSIMLPKKEEESINLFSLVIIVAFLSCSVFFLIFFFFHDQIISFFNIKLISGWLLLVPLSVFILSVNNALNYFFNRHKKYKLIAINKVNKNWGMGISQLSFGYFNLKSIGLIGGQMIGDFLSTILLGINFIKYNHLSFLRLNFSFPSIKKLIKEYKKFPLFTMPTVFMNNISSEILTILVAMWFSNGLTGAYYFTIRILNAPMGLIGSALSQTYFQKFTEIINEGTQNPKPFIIKVWLGLLGLAIVPLTILFIWGEDMFVIVFGPEWREAGKIASIMAPMTLFTFISSPTSSSFIVLRKQNYNFIFGIIELIYRPLTFYIGYRLNDFLLGLKILVCLEIINVFAYNTVMWKSIKKAS
jgi:O-antigen/teichoic acid export membrane protein